MAQNQRRIVHRYINVFSVAFLNAAEKYFSVPKIASPEARKKINIKLLLKSPQRQDHFKKKDKKVVSAENPEKS